MKQLGKIICLAGSVAALLYPPYLFLGSRHWGFVGGAIVAAFGRSVRVYDHLDVPTLLLELILINVVGIALILAGGRQK